jgi:SAM-dependent methyltransferase
MTEVSNNEEHVSRTYSNSYFFGGGAGYPNYLLEERMLIKHGMYYASLAEKVLKKTGSILDVGSAAGFILKGFAEKGWNCTGIEPNETMAMHARNRLALNVKATTVEKLSTDEKFDWINIVQVIAHIIDPLAVVGQLKKLLKNRGAILIETWDYQSITARIFGKRWHEYSPPSVLHWFSKISCDQLFIRNGFIRVATGRPPKKIEINHALALIKFKFSKLLPDKPFELFCREFKNELYIPYPFDDIFWAIYQPKS